MTTKTWLDQSPPSDHKRVIVNKLTNGQKSAMELQSLLKSLSDGSMTSRWEELAMEIVTSFDQSLSVLSEARLSLLLCGGDDQQCSNGGGVAVKAEQSHVKHSHCGNRGLEDSGESKKRPPGAKDRRGCYKRRKNSETWTKVSSTIEDGQAWRKYGQKEILNATYPRAYFRCTRKYDQGCQAAKQVQQIQDAPEKVYKTTYIGNHSCKTISIPHMSLDASNPPALVSHDAPPRATSSSESESIPVKKEESLTSSGVTENGNYTSDMWPEFDFELPEAETNVLSDEDVVSKMQFLEMHLVKSIDFDSEFGFDEIAFPLGL